VRVGEKAKVIKLERQTDDDRSAYVDQVALVVRRLNVPWTPDTGALWELRFDEGKTLVFAESEIAEQTSDGDFRPVPIDELREQWGDAPRRPSLPFKKFGAGSGSGPAVLALLVFFLAGVLLLWAAVAEGSAILGIAGGLLVLIGIGASAALVS
jgi:hypothetical protein